MRKIYGLALFAAAALSLAACSNKADTASSADTAAAQEGADEGANPDLETITIGTTGPLTGGAASYGISVKQGAEIAIEEINKAGGVKLGDKSYNFALQFEDDEASEEKAVTAYNTLLDKKVDVIMGAVTSGSSLAIADLTKKDNLLQLTPSGSAAGITANDNVFRLCFTDPLQGKMIADYVVNQGYESVAVLYNNADEYSTGVYEAFKDELTESGNADLLVAEESFVTGDVEFSSQLTKIKATDAKLIFVPAYYEAAAYIAKQVKDLGVEADIVGSDGWDGVLGQVTDTSVLDGIVFLTPFYPSDPNENVQSFVKAYKEKYNNAVPDQFAADSYDSVYVLKAAFEKAQSKDTEALIKAMTEINVDGLTGNISFDVSGDPIKQPKFVTIMNGVYESKELD
jgi:extracellular ligand-binding receptor